MMRVRWVILGLVAFMLLVAGAALAETIAANQPHRAGLVVSFPDHTEAMWIEFSEDEITGADLLERSGLDVTFSGFGGLGLGVCAIKDVGCFDPGDCFCQCKSGSCKFWAYFRMDDGKWLQSALGASSRKLKDGDVDGWAWGSGSPPAQWLTPIPCPTPTAPPPAQQPPVEPAVPTNAPPDGGAQAPVSGSDAPKPASSHSPTGSPEARRLPPDTATLSGASQTSPPSTPGGSAMVGRVDAVDPRDGDDGADPTPDGYPMNLIAFGVVAAAMVVAAGAAVARRRMRD